MLSWAGNRRRRAPCSMVGVGNILINTPFWKKAAQAVVLWRNEKELGLLGGKSTSWEQMEVVEGEGVMLQVVAKRVRTGAQLFTWVEDFLSWLLDLDDTLCMRASSCFQPHINVPCGWQQLLHAAGMHGALIRASNHC